MKAFLHYALLHSHCMDGKQLLKALMTEAKVNPNALANLLKNRSLQSQIQRFVDGKTRNPRWDTLLPVADFFQIRVEALFDADVARQVALERGLIKPSEVNEEVAVYAVGEKLKPLRGPITKPTLFELLIQLGEELKPFDQSARKAVASLLSDLALTPEDASVTASRIARLLGAPGNDPLQKSTSSQRHANGNKGDE